MDPNKNPPSMVEVAKRLRQPPGPQLRGWQLANQEHKAMGEPEVSYEEWIKTATPPGK
jgi:hypothetical protein